MRKLYNFKGMSNHITNAIYPYVLNFCPQYFSILSVAGSIFVVRICCAEIVNVLAVLSIFTGLSSSFFGVTLLSWANSIGDLIANQYLARQGYQNMALAACFGGPLFSELNTYIHRF